MISIIVAYDEDRSIGHTSKQGILWHVKDDMRLFKELTTGHPVIMGRTTWESLPHKPLGRRANIILTRQRDFDFAHLDVSPAYSLAESMDIARRVMPDKEVFVIGGAQVYRQFLEQNLVNRVLASEIYGRYGGNISFPNLGSGWVVNYKHNHKRFSFKEYVNTSYVNTSKDQV